MSPISKPATSTELAQVIVRLRKTSPDTVRTLERCVGDADEFLATYWNRRPLHTASTDDLRYADLLGIDTLDTLLNSLTYRPSAIRLFKAGQQVDNSEVLQMARAGGRGTGLPTVDITAVKQRFVDGTTVVLEGLHRHWPPLQRLCQHLEDVLTQAVQANAYLTPPHASGLPPHEDAHDVIVLQTYGEKHWQIHEARQNSPADEPTNLVLRPGQALYLPRGTTHSASTLDQPSVHVTVGIKPMTWSVAMNTLLALVLDELDIDGHLPAGHAHGGSAFAADLATQVDRVIKHLQNQDAGALASRLADRFWRTRNPDIGSLGDLLRQHDLDDETTLSTAGPVAIEEEQAARKVALRHTDRTLRFPIRLAPLLRNLFDRDTFRVRDLAPYLDRDSRILLARVLVREGLLRIDARAQCGSATLRLLHDYARP
jgi:hypothetical protein